MATRAKANTVAASKSRLLWHQLPASVQTQISRLANANARYEADANRTAFPDGATLQDETALPDVLAPPDGLALQDGAGSGSRVVAAQNCEGGFSPGLASRLRFADGRRFFVKAMDADAWPHEAVTYRTEVAVTAALPVAVPAPRLLGTFDDGHWIVLVFEDIDGREPTQPWSVTDLRRVVSALVQMAAALTPSPIAAPADHPRLGGWAELAADAACLAKLESLSPWAAGNLDRLIELEQQGIAAAKAGSTLLHFDVYAHNILLTPERVVFVDWPHARIGNPLVDLVLLLSSAAADGIDPEPFIDPDRPHIDAILAANAGFLLAGGLSEPVPGLEAIPRMKLHLGTGALAWLERRQDALPSKPST